MVIRFPFNFYAYYHRRRHHGRPGVPQKTQGHTGAHTEPGHQSTRNKGVAGTGPLKGLPLGAQGLLMPHLGFPKTKGPLAAVVDKAVVVG
jgi:hypothetical protein